MTSASEASELPLLTGETWAMGNAVIATGANEDGIDSLAVWQLSPLGTPVGAWVLPRREAFSSPQTARQLLSVMEQRAITAADPAHIDLVLTQLSATAELGNQQWWLGQTFSLPHGLAELLERRQAYYATVEKARAQRPSIAKLNWSRDFTPDDYADFDSLRKAAGIRVSAPSSVARSALSVSRVLQWLANVWSETEQIKNRRSYVRQAHGAAEPLPPSWLKAIHTANSTRIAL